MKQSKENRQLYPDSLKWNFIRDYFLKSKGSTTLWVRDTCLFVGPLFILITASFCSEKYEARHRSEKVLRLKWHNQHLSSHDFLLCFFVFALECFHGVCRAIGCPVLWVDLRKNVIRQQPNPRDQEREHHPREDLHLGTYPQNQWNCVKLKFVSCTSNEWDRNFDFRRYIEFLPRLILSLQDPQQNRNPETMLCCISHMTVLSVITCAVNCIVVLCFPQQCCSKSVVWWMDEIKRAKRLSQALVHFATARASLFTDHRMSGLSIRARYKHFRTILEQTFDTSPTVPNSFFLNSWSSRHGVETFFSWLNLLIRRFAKLFNAFLRMSFPVIGSRSNVPGNFTVAPAGFEHFSVFVNQTFVRFTLGVECIPSTRDQEMMLVLQDQPASSISSTPDLTVCGKNVRKLLSAEDEYGDYKVTRDSSEYSGATRDTLLKWSVRFQCWREEL